MRYYIYIYICNTVTLSIYVVALCYTVNIFQDSQTVLEQEFDNRFHISHSVLIDLLLFNKVVLLKIIYKTFHVSRHNIFHRQHKNYKTTTLKKKKYMQLQVQIDLSLH